MQDSDKPTQKARSQRERFIEAARQLGADESEAAFKERLEKIAKQEEKGDEKPGSKPTGRAGKSKRD